MSAMRRALLFLFCLALAARVGFNGSYAVDWTWDAARRVWLRSTSGRPFVVASGNQISATNVVIMAITYRGGPGAMQAEGILWTRQNGQDVDGPTNDLLVNPPIFNSTSMICVVR